MGVNQSELDKHWELVVRNILAINRAIYDAMCLQLKDSALLSLRWSNEQPTDFPRFRSLGFYTKPFNQYANAHYQGITQSVYADAVRDLEPHFSRYESFTPSSSDVVPLSINYGFLLDAGNETGNAPNRGLYSTIGQAELPSTVYPTLGYHRFEAFKRLMARFASLYNIIGSVRNRNHFGFTAISCAIDGCQEILKESAVRQLLGAGLCAELDAKMQQLVSSFNALFVSDLRHDGERSSLNRRRLLLMLLHLPQSALPRDFLQAASFQAQAELLEAALADSRLVACVSSTADVNLFCCFCGQLPEDQLAGRGESLSALLNRLHDRWQQTPPAKMRLEYTCKVHDQRSYLPSNLNQHYHRMLADALITLKENMVRSDNLIGSSLRIEGRVFTSDDSDQEFKDKLFLFFAKSVDSQYATPLEFLKFVRWLGRHYDNILAEWANRNVDRDMHYRFNAGATDEVAAPVQLVYENGEFKLCSNQQLAVEAANHDVLADMFVDMQATASPGSGGEGDYASILCLNIKHSMSPALMQAMNLGDVHFSAFERQGFLYERNRQVSYGLPEQSAVKLVQSVEFTKLDYAAWQKLYYLFADIHQDFSNFDKRFRNYLRYSITKLPAERLDDIIALQLAFNRVLQARNVPSDFAAENLVWLEQAIAAERQAVAQLSVSDPNNSRQDYSGYRPQITPRNPLGTASEMTHYLCKRYHQSGVMGRYSMTMIRDEATEMVQTQQRLKAAREQMHRYLQIHGITLPKFGYAAAYTKLSRSKRKKSIKIDRAFMVLIISEQMQHLYEQGLLSADDLRMAERTIFDILARNDADKASSLSGRLHLGSNRFHDHLHTIFPSRYSRNTRDDLNWSLAAFSSIETQFEKAFSTLSAASLERNYRGLEVEPFGSQAFVNIVLPKPPSATLFAEAAAPVTAEQPEAAVDQQVQQLTTIRQRIRQILSLGNAKLLACHVSLPDATPASQVVSVLAASRHTADEQIKAIMSTLREEIQQLIDNYSRNGHDLICEYDVAMYYLTALNSMHEQRLSAEHSLWLGKALGRDALGLTYYQLVECERMLRAGHRKGKSATKHHELDVLLQQQADSIWQSLADCEHFKSILSLYAQADQSGSPMSTFESVLHYTEYHSTRLINQAATIDELVLALDSAKRFNSNLFCMPHQQDQKVDSFDSITALAQQRAQALCEAFDARALLASTCQDLGDPREVYRVVLASEKRWEALAKPGMTSLFREKLQTVVLQHLDELMRRRYDEACQQLAQGNIDPVEVKAQFDKALNESYYYPEHEESLRQYQRDFTLLYQQAKASRLFAVKTWLPLSLPELCNSMDELDERQQQALLMLSQLLAAGELTYEKDVPDKLKQVIDKHAYRLFNQDGFMRPRTKVDKQRPASGTSSSADSEDEAEMATADSKADATALTAAPYDGTTTGVVLTI